MLRTAFFPYCVHLFWPRELPGITVRVSAWAIESQEIARGCELEKVKGVGIWKA